MIILSKLVEEHVHLFRICLQLIAKSSRNCLLLKIVKYVKEYPVQLVVHVTVVLVNVPNVNLVIQVLIVKITFVH